MDIGCSKLRLCIFMVSQPAIETFRTIIKHLHFHKLLNHYNYIGIEIVIHIHNVLTLEIGCGFEMINHVAPKL